MNFRQLECFVAVVDEGSFTRAARRIGITQPSLSQHIKALELELDGAVLDRLPRGVSLTPAGRGAPARGADRGARARARPPGRALRARARARRARDRDGALDGGRRAAAPHRRLARAASERRDPAARVPPPQPARGRRRAGRRRLRGRAASPLRRGTARSRPSRWEEFVLVVAPSDPLAERRSVKLEELRDREWVLYHPDHGLAGIVEEICRGAGFRPRGTVRTSQAEGAVRLAAAGLGHRARARQHRAAGGSTARSCGSRRA